MKRIVVAISFLCSLSVALMPGTFMAASGQSGGPYDPLNAPTFQQQTSNWTAANFAFYNSKLAQVQDFHKAKATGGAKAYYCIPQCVPNSHYATMSVIFEGSADCACGPATATEMYSTFTHYYAQPSTAFTLSQVESQMGFNCSVGTYRSQLSNEMNRGTQTHNSYVWQSVASGSDVYDYTAVDLGGVDPNTGVTYNFPPGYDGETYGTNGYPLDNHQGVDWKHYFPAYGYDASYNVYVADPHFAADHRYTSTAVWKFIQNFPFQAQVLW
jgi:hypothetical protein